MERNKRKKGNIGERIGKKNISKGMRRTFEGTSQKRER